MNMMVENIEYILNYEPIFREKAVKYAVDKIISYQQEAKKKAKEKLNEEK